MISQVATKQRWLATRMLHGNGAVAINLPPSRWNSVQAGCAGKGFGNSSAHSASAGRKQDPKKFRGKGKRRARIISDPAAKSSTAPKSYSGGYHVNILDAVVDGFDKASTKIIKPFFLNYSFLVVMLLKEALLLRGIPSHVVNGFVVANLRGDQAYAVQHVWLETETDVLDILNRLYHMAQNRILETLFAPKSVRRLTPALNLVTFLPPTVRLDEGGIAECEAAAAMARERSYLEANQYDIDKYWSACTTPWMLQVREEVMIEFGKWSSDH